MILKILSYNILLGFHKNATSNYEFEKKRLDAVKKIIKEEKPDILGLNEAFFNAPNKHNISMNYREIFGYKYSVNGMHFWDGTTILSNIPLEDSFTMSDDHGTGVGAQIKIKNKKLNLVLIHPTHDKPDEQKISFVKPILDNIKNNLILFGDFNALSDDDSYEKEKMDKAFKLFAGRHYQVKVNRLMDTKLIPLVKSYGLRDVLLSQGKQEPTIPTELIKQKINCPIRLDYFFASKDIKVISAKTIKNKYSEVASDHYPIICEIEI